MIADAVADYAGRAARGSPDGGLKARAVAKFVVNELLENAVKFHAPGPIQVCARHDAQDLVLQISHQISPPTAHTLRTWLAALACHGADDLLRRQVEDNAENSTARSGIGLLTLINDYRAILDWWFGPGTRDNHTLTTLARVPVEALQKGHVMEIKGGNYRVWYNPDTQTVGMEGILRLGDSSEYQPIEELLEKVLASGLKVVTLDLRALTFLNSAGINVLYKFAIATRKKAVALRVTGSQDVPWQPRSLPNLKKFNENCELTLE